MCGKSEKRVICVFVCLVTLQKEQAVDRLKKTHLDKVAEQAKVSISFPAIRNYETIPRALTGDQLVP